MMPDCCKPSLSKSCCRLAMNPRKILPAPKCTHTGCFFVYAVILSTSKLGSSTPSIDHCAICLFISFSSERQCYTASFFYATCRIISVYSFQLFFPIREIQYSLTYADVCKTCCTQQPGDYFLNLHIRFCKTAVGHAGSFRLLHADRYLFENFFSSDWNKDTLFFIKHFLRNEPVAKHFRFWHGDGDAFTVRRHVYFNFIHITYARTNNAAILYYAVCFCKSSGSLFLHADNIAVIILKCCKFSNMENLGRHIHVPLFNLHHSELFVSIKCTCTKNTNRNQRNTNFYYPERNMEFFLLHSSIISCTKRNCLFLWGNSSIFN